MKDNAFTLALSNHLSLEYKVCISSTSKYLWVLARERCYGDDTRRTEIRLTTICYLHLEAIPRQGPRRGNMDVRPPATILRVPHT